VPTSMSRAEREQFLAGVHVAVLSVAAATGAGPLTVPVWYSYEPGGLVSVSTDRGSRKAVAIGAAGRFTLCAQDEQPPYKYVTVEGPAVIEPATLEERRALARRYLGPADGDAFIDGETGAEAEAGTGADAIMIRMTPQHWLAADFSKS
jgi:nitroimidazol reductase NimA-like FMN-containing flavoprotein (pyridoxamine 5'-phosphate oxidase superfamily)